MRQFTVYATCGVYHAFMLTVDNTIRVDHVSS